MKKLFFLFISILWITTSYSQQLKTGQPNVDKAFTLAIETVNKNIQDSLIKAGGFYGGEWTRDISINAWHATSLVWPQVTRYSLWSVTENNRQLIGHEYWDKIIWVVGAYNHYLVNNDKEFLRQAYIASANTMTQQENSTFDAQYGLFMGPSVFNDGIAGYEEPIYDGVGTESPIVAYPAHKTIKCLSTNCVYYEAYVCLGKMAEILNKESEVQHYQAKAETLKNNIRTHLYDEKKNRLNYLIDQHGDVHTHQEALGISFAILFDIVSREEAKGIIADTYTSEYGVPSIYPCFKRFSKEKPGRHNVMIWPFVNGFWVDACHKTGVKEQVLKEILSLADLAIVKGNNCFYEIYNEQTGEQDGGWQVGRTWSSIYDQTWSATGYMRMIFKGLLGMEFTPEYMELNPDFGLLQSIGFQELSSLPYRNTKVTIKCTGKGTTPVKTLLNGKEVNQVRINPVSSPTEVIVEYIF
ncbi:MAG: hypothetical protein LUG18_09715 [Candidatus Azobacteroides sp.]|nr:hypothetical protein [Candidatus Azobacteroides sp.]